ncbi:hypothetical protein MX088_002332 [Escherichia coli]|nr:hypothetical protein [Escherichia coli]
MTPRQRLITSNDDVLAYSGKDVVAATKIGTLLTVHFANFSLEIQTDNEREATACMHILKASMGAKRNTEAK